MKPKCDKSPKADCFAYSKDKNRCNALSELVCTYKDKCSFYKHRANVNLREIELAVRSYTGPK